MTRKTAGGIRGKRQTNDLRFFLLTERGRDEKEDYPPGSRTPSPLTNYSW